MKLSALLLCVLSLATVAGVQAAKYIQPNESKELFKVEKIPLQVDSMKELSRHLTILARRNQDDSAVQRRGTAQLLAIAMRLNSANQQARETDQAMRNNEKINTPGAENILKAKARLRFFERWLATPDAGADANALALYISDATRVLRDDALNDPDQANWTGILPPLAEYKGDKKIAKTADPTPPIPTKPAEGNKPTIENPYKIPQLTIMMPLTIDTVTKFKDPNNNLKETWSRKSSEIIFPVKLEISPQQQPLSISVNSQLGPGNAPQDTGGLQKSLAFLKTRLNSSPANRGAKASLKIGHGPGSSGMQYSNKNGSAAAAATELMLAASKAGKELRKDVHLCAALQNDGQLCLPKNFWIVLESMRKDDGQTGRLIVPKAAEGALTELLVLSEPDFFTRWEVIGVDSINQALTYAAADSDAKVVAAGELFLSIRRLTDKDPVTKIAINKAVRSRLSQILSLAPEHLSAKILLLQGSGKRPMRLSKLGIAYNIHPTVKNMQSSFSKVNADYQRASTVKKIHESARAALDPIDRLVDSREDELYQEALELANELRSLYTLIKRNERFNSNTNVSKAKAMNISIKTRIAKLEAAIALTIAKQQRDK